MPNFYCVYYEHKKLKNIFFLNRGTKDVNVFKT